jgi:DNA primase
MIDAGTIERIYDAADIVDVVKEFVNLKKRGANYLGLCPFHNEKTPSFSVSHARGIYKCFGCGKGGNAVNFIMEHEHLTYYEALKYLAKKYHIEIIEKELTPEDIQHQNDRESLLVVTAYGQKVMADTLFNHPEGKTVGLSYFKERGFREEILHKFGLGYSPEKRDYFTQLALKDGYTMEFLEKSGLTIKKEDYIFDRFHSRVIFPIHALSGKVIGFGGRILRSDKTIAKYLNSPESEIYVKSKIVYGIYHARKAIEQADSCFLVEGYTDVLAMHQAGLENVVASSGTSLTPDQVRLIKRFTNNITVLYDGDSAGIKASLRGIDIILEEGMNVKVVLLPDGEDPDSYSKKVSNTELLEYIAKNERDFISFKTLLLLDESKNDPIRRASLITEVVKSIAIIPDAITRSEFIRECSTLLKTDERLLLSQIMKIRRERNARRFTPAGQEQEVIPAFRSQQQVFTPTDDIEFKEREIVRLLLTYGNLVLERSKDEVSGEQHETTVAERIIHDLTADELELLNPVYRQIFHEYRTQSEQQSIITEKYFIQHPDASVSKAAADLLTQAYTLSKIWEKNENYVETEEMLLKKIVPDTIHSYKHKKIIDLIEEAKVQLKEAYESQQEEKTRTLQERIKELNTFKQQLSKELNRPIP